jgi:hypothetical protein
MSLLRPFLEARAVLGVTAEDDAAAVKRAYRKLALAHPPDTDPEGFRRVREAYELLAMPADRVREMLLARQPWVEPPPLPPPPRPPPRGSLSLAILRLAAGAADAAALLQAEPAPPAVAPPRAIAAPAAEERKPPR